MAAVGTWTCRHCQTNNAQDRDRCSYCRKHRKNDITVSGLLAVVVLAAIILLFVAPPPSRSRTCRRRGYQLTRRGISAVAISASLSVCRTNKVKRSSSETTPLV